ncbi:MAG: CRISPR-associated endonuclease Cas2 [Saprospiraceae bacterium]|nr:CRISPR-associated endonuclease Cas2 [Saprospiraceae bacterium]
MARPPNKEYDLTARIRKLRESGFTVVQESADEMSKVDGTELLPLPQRIQLILGIIKNKPVKAISMNYLILYDIENHKVRRMVAKYLLSKGCIRVQKSVFLCHSDHPKFDDIRITLTEINDVYENRDSIILVPLNVSDARSMKLIGKNVNIEQIIDPPNTVFI